MITVQNEALKPLRSLTLFNLLLLGQKKDREIMNKYTFAITKNLTLMCGNYEFEDSPDELCFQLDTDVIESSGDFLRQIPQDYIESIKSNYRDSFDLFKCIIM